MNVSNFIASRLQKQAQKSFSALIIKVAKVATALSLTVMIVAVAMVNGFQKEIRNKAYNLWGNIQIAEYADNHSYENSPIKLSDEKLKQISSLPEIKHLQAFAIKPGIMKKGEQIEGIVLKGIDKNFQSAFFEHYVKNFSGDVKSVFDFNDSTPSNKIIVSKKIADRLHLKIGDNCFLYFIDKSPRVRKMNVAAIYSTGLEEFDKVYSFVDLRVVQKLNNWNNGEVGGYELFVNDVKKIDTVNSYINQNILPLNFASQTIYQLFPTLFDWLNLQDMTEQIIIILMTVVALINVITCFLILILERTQMIGILKTLGMQPFDIKLIFLSLSRRILVLAMLWGNAVGLSICALQYYFKIIKLPEETYYISEVAIDFNWTIIGVINIGFIAVVLLSLWLPAFVINYIRPIKAIRFE